MTPRNTFEVWTWAVGILVTLVYVPAIMFMAVNL